MWLIDGGDIRVREILIRNILFRSIHHNIRHIMQLYRVSLISPVGSAAQANGPGSILTSKMAFWVSARRFKFPFSKQNIADSPNLFILIPISNLLPQQATMPSSHDV